MSKKKKLRGAVVSALSLSMALSSLSVVSAQSVNDVQGHWAEQQIQSWIENGSLKGYQDGSVKPNNSITRVEFITLVNRIFGFTDPSAANFKDLSPSNWAYNDVAKAVNAGYVKGYSDNTFHPGSNVSRQEAATMISNILGLNTSNTEEIKQFTDAGKIPTWSQGSVAAVIEKGIMKGYPDGTFQAQKQLTRAEAVVLIESAMSNREVAAETVTIDKAGIYGNMQETKIVNGDVIINVPGVTLENYEIKGNLLLAAGIGSGDVTIKNVKVHGTTNVEGGGENSIHFVDSVLVNILVNKKDGTVRLVAEGTTKAQKVIVQSSAKLEESDLNGEGFTDVELAKELPANATVQLNGKFDDVDIFSASVSVKLLSGSIQDVTVDAAAANNTIQLSSGAQVVNLVLNAISKLLGASNITTVTLNSGSQNSTFDARPSNVQGDQKGSIIVNTPSTATSSSSGSSSSGGSSSGGSGGGSTGGGGDQTKVTYTVAFNLNGADGTAPTSATVEAGKTVTLPAAPTRAGYTFAGWNTVADGSGTSLDGTTVINGNTTAFAQWYLAAPANGLKTLNVARVTETGAKFLAAGLVNESGAEVPSTLGEIKEYIENKYEVSFNAEAISVVDGQISITGSVLSPADWAKVKANGNKTIPYRITLVEDGTKVKAAKIAMYQDGNAVIESFQAEEVTQYTVSFDLNGADGTAPTAATVEAGKTVTLPVEPTREGYVFAGWNTVADGSGTSVDGTTVINGNITAYAQWHLAAPANGLKTLNVARVTETGAKFLAAGLVNESGAEVASALGEIKEYIENKYEVSFNAEAISVVDGKISITGSVLSPADWAKVKANGNKTIPYRITLLEDGTKVKAAKIAMYQDGNAVIESFQAEEVTQYTVSFDLNGANGTAPTAATVEAGKTVTLPAAPSREGYAFAGWNTVVDGSGVTVDGTTAINANTTLYAQWEAQLVAPTDGLNELEISNVTVAEAKFLVFGLNKENSDAQKPSTLDEVKTFINGKYEVAFNADAIQLENGKISITGSILNTADWNKVKTNGNKTVPYRITLLDDAGVKVAKVAMYQDGKAVIETLN
ncbi:InlB B-repeat-containing protein [Paenibacillus taichungensis]|uniref:InlB B-repeat-containing protein n=1 Tax=Paenibacillus taichungensis TaxID=484184 RepID=UPI002871359B|nr:InlB B-repeat-containing protein [Paenibacillus taichungensis]MDR9749525.1 InlB B-repeat-containing protein [Paenibacillus taichungensis]